MTQSTDYFAPEGLRTRGTVIVVPGRGETPGTYARFGSRLAYDAYRVRVIGPPPAGAATIRDFLAGAARAPNLVGGVGSRTSTVLPALRRTARRSRSTAHLFRRSARSRST